jgi:4-deoxy-L-threo-5-hexosulose-uronate ketol-isomerase
MKKPFKPKTTPRAQDITTMSGDELRRTFMVEQVMNEGKLSWTFTDLDRMALAGIKPGGGPVKLENDPETGRQFFLERRELGIINTGGGRGSVRVDGKAHEMSSLDCLYVGMGAKDISFEGDGNAKFFLLSCPAHQTYPTTLVRKAEAKPLDLGSQATANKRKIFQYIHLNGIKSCQLVMGWTELAEGSVWNTMPPHTHSRRTEIYYYFDIAPDNIVAHFMGPPDNTRHLFIQNEQAVLSPAWSIHCGCGTQAYKFIWAMAGENQTFDDMDKVGPLELR